MNKFLTGTIGAIAVAVAVPALAADMAPRGLRRRGRVVVVTDLLRDPNPGGTRGAARCGA